jgi:hypothetical protein
MQSENILLIFEFLQYFYFWFEEYSVDLVLEHFEVDDLDCDRDI